MIESSKRRVKVFAAQQVEYYDDGGVETKAKW